GVLWEQSGGRFSLTVKAPGGTRGTVALPGDSARVVVRQGRKVLWDGRRGASRDVRVTDGRVTVSVGAGAHTFTVEPVR
ncbi:hypothetical protein GTW43_12680, partial [Streptomyces sp. SID5785]|uniref:hypothetical protein n=1 Tax=Streptomyces sp. SID5785 TaxID=2690309 RepID=UPI00136104B3